MLSELSEKIANLSSGGKMPVIWAWLFLSALFTIAGHTVYQIFCPKIVQEYSLREYIKTRLEEEKSINDHINLESIVKESRSEYDDSSTKKRVYSFIAMLLYFCAIYSIFRVIWSQTESVMRAVGWM